MYAAATGNQTDVVVSALANKYKLDPDQRGGPNGWAPIHYAAAAGNVETVAALVRKAGADPNIRQGIVDRR